MALAGPLLLHACHSDAQKLSLTDGEPAEFALPAHPQILFFVDGLRADVLEELRAEGKLPRLQEHLLDRGARVRSAVVCVPSVTYPNAVTMLTGCWPSTHGVWANVCFDREALLGRNFEVMREHAEGDAARPSMFELLQGELTASIAMPFERGSKVSFARSLGSGGEVAWAGWMLGKKQFTDLRLSEQLYEIESLARRVGEWPAFIAIHLPAIDGVGHESGSDSDTYREAVLNLETAIGEVLEAFDAGGLLDDLTIVLTADHGHHPVKHSVALKEVLADVLDVPVLLCSENDGELEYLQRWEHCAPFQAIVTVTGHREASIHLRAGSRWGDRPIFEEIMAFPALVSGRKQSLPELLLLSPGIDLVAVRANDDEVRVYDRTGAAAIRRQVDGDEVTFSYERLSGADPLDYPEKIWEWIGEGEHGSREWLEATAEERHPDLVPQLAVAFDHPRSGDVMVFAAPGWGFCAAEAGGHGGIEREEMIVPLYIAGPGIRPGTEIAAARLVDLVPTLLELSGTDTRPHRFDGVSLARKLR